MTPTLAPFGPIIQLAWPMLVAQLAMMLMPLIDTMMIGHYHTTDLAAVALGNSLYITVFLTLSGVLQALSPQFAHHHGAQATQAIREDFQQGVWLALLLGALGWILLSHPQWLLRWTQAETLVLAKAESYLRALAWGVPAVMLYKVATALMGATQHQRAIMWISLIGVTLNVPLNYVLIWGDWRDWGLQGGAAGSGLATAIACLLNVLMAAVYLRRHPDTQRYRLFERWQAPRWPAQWRLAKLGLPIAFSLLVEISAFTLVALFVARLGPTTIGGHRIAAQMAGLCYMLPLALGTATAILVGQACGGGNFARARQTAWYSALLAGVLATLIGLAVFLAREPISRSFSNDPAVCALAAELMLFIALYQFFDGVQTIGTFALRGYKVTLAPMWIHVLCFWVIGLGGGYWLAFSEVQLGPWQLGPTGAAGFWGASVVSTVAAAALLAALMHRVSQQKAADYAPARTPNA